MAEYFVMMIGCDGVGKTAMCHRFLRPYSLDEYDVLEETSCRNEVRVDGENYVLDLSFQNYRWESVPMRDRAIAACQGFLSVFSITDRQSFEDLKVFCERVQREKGDSVPMVIVGNKCDLEACREVTTSEGSIFAAQRNATYIETSAQTGINLYEAFFQLTRKLNKQFPRVPVNPHQSDCCCSLL